MSHNGLFAETVCSLLEKLNMKVTLIIRETYRSYPKFFDSYKMQFCGETVCACMYNLVLFVKMNSEVILKNRHDWNEIKQHEQLDNSNSK